MRRLAATRYLYGFCGEFVLLYPLYALLFADSGLSPAAISSLFVVWSLTAVVLEVPSGVLADLLPRRLLLALSPLFAAAGFACWVAAPSYWSFLLGFVAWGVGGALRSGAQEALVYDELARLGAASRYAAVAGRAVTAEQAGVLAAAAAAGPVFAVGGYPALALASVLSCLACAAAAAALPEHRRRDPYTDPAPVPDETDEDEPGFLGTLRAALRQARASAAVRRLLWQLPVLAAIWSSLEEYVPLVAAGAADTALVPALVFAVGAGTAAGGLLAPAGRRLPRWGLAGLLVLATAATAAGVLAGHPAGLLAVAAAFGIYQLATVVAEARLQDGIDGAARATVTSVAGLLTEVVSITAYLLYALLALLFGAAAAFALLAAAYLPLALAWARHPAPAAGS